MPQTETAADALPPPPELHVDLSGPPQLIWRSFIDHIGDLSAAILTALGNSPHDAAASIWNAAWHSCQPPRGH